MYPAIGESDIPRAAVPLLQHAISTYAGEVSKISSVWSQFADADLEYRPHPRSSTVAEIIRHQLLSERRFFGEFLGTPEPAPDRVLPRELTIEASCGRLVELAKPRLGFLAAQVENWWLESRPFFDVTRERIWIFLRRILHSAHHRTQLTVYLRLLEKAVPSTYGPTADVTWTGADPTLTVEAAGRK
jgi:uncharacterized damage-inducible protein DinB